MIITWGVGITAAAGTNLTPPLFFRLFTSNKRKINFHWEFLYQNFFHCKIFVTAAIRRSYIHVSEYNSGLPLSRPLLITDLGVLYTSNNLFRFKPTFCQKNKFFFSNIFYSKNNILLDFTNSFP